MHSNVRALIRAVKHHELIAGADEATRRVFAGLAEAAERELAPQADGQMFTDEFIGEVIGIDLLRYVEMVLPDQEPQARWSGTARELYEQEPVKVKVLLGRKSDDIFEFTGEGVTMGFALRDVREQIRRQYGR